MRYWMLFAVLFVVSVATASDIRVMVHSGQFAGALTFGSDWVGDYGPSEEIAFAVSEGDGEQILANGVGSFVIEIADMEGNVLWSASETILDGQIYAVNVYGPLNIIGGFSEVPQDPQDPQEPPPPPFGWPTPAEQVTWFLVGAAIVAPLLASATVVVFARRAAQTSLGGRE